MKVRIDRTRMATSAIVFGYDVTVPLNDCPPWMERFNPTRIMRDSNHKNPLVRFDQATVSERHTDMEKGWDRYDDWQKHEKRADKAALSLAKSVFPELQRLDQYERLPTCVEFGKEMANETHATRWVTLVDDPFGYAL